MTPQVFAQSNADLLAKLKTAYLYNIVKFVEWRSAPKEVTLCLQAGTQLDQFVTALHGRSIGERRLQVANADGNPTCNVYYGKVHSDFAQSDRVLSISDDPDALNRGADLQFIIERGQLRFKVNKRITTTSASELDFQVSSKLLRLSRGS